MIGSYLNVTVAIGDNVRKHATKPQSTDSVDSWLVQTPLHYFFFGSQTHDLKLVDAATATDVANSVETVNTSGATAGSFIYASLPANVVLLANHSYFLLSQEGNGGSSDSWYRESSRRPILTMIIMTGCSDHGSRSNQ